MRTGLPTLCLKKVWKLCEVLNIRGTAGLRRAQAQEITAGTRHSSRFCLGPLNFFAEQSKKTGILGFLLGVLNGMRKSRDFKHI